MERIHEAANGGDSGGRVPSRTAVEKERQWNSLALEAMRQVIDGPDGSLTMREHGSPGRAVQATREVPNQRHRSINSSERRPAIKIRAMRPGINRFKLVEPPP